MSEHDPELHRVGVTGQPRTVPVVEIVVPASEVDLASGLLWTAGVAAVAEHPRPDGSVLLRVDAPDGGGAAVRDAIAGRWPVAEVDIDDGLDVWRQHATATRVGRVVVLPPWLPPPEVAPDDVVVTVDPGRSFGHGAHPTTVLCLEAVTAAVDAGARTVLDVGCGSGVLAIAAARLGAERVHAVDIDDVAAAVTLANAAANQLTATVTAEVAPTPDRWAGHSADLVVANIGAETLRALGPALVGSIAPGGTLVVSGLLDPPPDDLVQAFAPLRIVADSRLDGWTALTLR